MSTSVYSPVVVIGHLVGDFFPRRGLRLAGRGGAAGATSAPTSDAVIAEMGQFGHVRLDAVREAPRGRRDWVVVLVLAPGGKHANHSPDLRRLLESLDVEKPAKEGRLDEVIVVAEPEFFDKKNMTDVIAARQAAAGGNDYDPAGAHPYYSAHSYRVFSCCVPASEAVPPHRTMTAAEVAALLAAERLADVKGLPAIPAADPPVIWLGARPGQVVEIERDSQSACRALYWRRVE